jgi:energy-coupling factor transporter ATP-binding protein EcfA2
MNSLSLTSFRKFSRLEQIKYKGITFLVGRNNSGKSTFVKALLLITDFLKSDNLRTYDYLKNQLDGTNISNHGLAARISEVEEDNNEQGKSYTIETELNNIKIFVSYGGGKEDTIATIMSIIFQDPNTNLSVFLFPSMNSVYFSKNKVKASTIRNKSMDTASLQIRIDELKTYLSKKQPSKTSKEYIEANTELNKLNEKLKLLNENVIEPDVPDYTVYQEYKPNLSLQDSIADAIGEIKSKYLGFYTKVQQGLAAPKEFEDLKAFVQSNPVLIEKFISDVYLNISNFNQYYIGANLTKPKRLFLIQDIDNPFSQTLREFSEFKIIAGEPEYEFVKRWLKKFEIGEDFKILFYAGEAMELTINTGTHHINLANMGMGSTQAALLIYKVACIIRQNNILKKSIQSNHVNPQVIIEEPERNLHPQLQSYLTDFLYEAHTEFGIDFVVETHSEYIVRKSQVIVAANKLVEEENPFSIIYFPSVSHEQPFHIGYNQDGTLDKNFGKGFFDEASNSTIELIKLKRLSQN